MTNSHIKFLSRSVSQSVTIQQHEPNPMVFREISHRHFTLMFRYFTNLVEILVRQRHSIWIPAYVCAIGLLTGATCSLFSL